VSEKPLLVCIATGHPVDPGDPYLHWEVTGWTRRRQSGMRGAKGGIHGLAQPTFTGRVYCDRHWTRLKQTGSAEQGALL